MLLNRVLFTWENVSWVSVQLRRLLFSQEGEVVPAGSVLKYVIRCLKHLGYLEVTLYLFLRNSPIATLILLSHWDEERQMMVLTMQLREAKPYSGVTIQLNQ